MAMKILVALHTLALGGSPITAIDLAAGARRHGHDVAVYGVPGPLTDYVHENELRFVPARPLRYRPAPSRILQLTALARRERIDLVHAYEWPPCLDAYFGAHLIERTPLVCTVYSMDVPPYVPKSVPLIMGTPALRRGSAATGASLHRGCSSRRSTRNAIIRRIEVGTFGVSSACPLTSFWWCALRDSR